MKKRNIISALLFAAFLLTACGENDAEYGSTNMDSISSAEENQTSTGIVNEEAVESCVKGMMGDTTGKGGKSIIPNTITDVTYRVEGNTVVIDFDKGIYDLDPYKKITTLADVTKCLCSIDNVENVSFTCEGFPLVDSTGNVYGLLTQESFVENEGALINAYERAELLLYFANEDGQKLVETRESLVYSSNISMDRLVVDKIISGPKSSGAYPTIDPSTVINAVTTQDGVCYVDLGAQFLNKTTNVSDEVMIYSIVNSLTALNGINKVQILIDGQSDNPLVTAIYERKLELVE